MLSIFSCACWPFVCLLWRKVYVGILPTFFYWIVYIFDIDLEDDDDESCSDMFDALWPHGLYSPWNSSGPDTGVGSLSLLQGIFSTQGSNPGLPHCRWILYQLSHREAQSCMSCWCILKISPLLVAPFVKIFSYCVLPFHFVYGFLCCAKAFKFN